MSSFSLQIGEFTKKATEQTRRAAQELVLSLFTRIVYRTPVGNPAIWNSDFVAAAKKLGWIDDNYVAGTLRANWQASIGSAKKDKLDTQDPNGMATVAKIRAVLALWDGKMPVYFTNNQPYAKAIEYGHSRLQAPQGMVRISLADVTARIAEIVKRATS